MAGRPLWAPWRIEYVGADRTDPCPLCLAASGDGQEGKLVIDRGRRCLTMLNAFPYASGHLMTLPLRHVGALEALESDELTELMSLAQRAVRALREVMRPHGFNLGVNLGTAAGAGIDEHLHLHVVPRWEGDTNFMPLLADTRVLPEALDATRKRLAAAIAEV
jgi:ATP adenylyltransferase